MKKYQIGGSMQSRTSSESSDELNPFKIKKPVAPNPSFVPSGSMDRAQQGVETQKKSDDGVPSTKVDAYALANKQYADELKIAKAKAMAALKNAKDKGEIPPNMKKGGQLKKSKKY
jgi:hypothetical protein